MRQPEHFAGVDEGRARFEFHGAAVDQHQGLRRGRAGLGHGVRDVLRPLAGAGEEDAVGERGHGRELRVPFGEEALGAAADVEHPADLLGVGLRLQGHREHDHVHRDLPHAADQRVLRAEDELPLLRAGPPQSLTSATRPRMRCTPSFITLS